MSPPLGRLLAILACLFFGASLRAQPQQTDSRKEFLARQITRLALFDLRVTNNPGTSDYRLTALLLGLAREFTPDDPELLRRQIEAAANAGDNAQVLELSRALLNLDREDTVTQLRLISASIARNQDADARIAAYEQFLDPKGPGKVLDPSVLSRLALDCALLYRERADDKGFIEKLKLAVTLDSTFKEAAAIAAAVVAERKPDDAIARLAMLENLLKADPVDPNVHASIARELALGGAYKAAQRFQENVVRILDAAALNADRARATALVLRWHAEGPKAVVEELSHELAVAKDEATRNIRRALQSGQPATNLPKPEDIQYSLDDQFLYLLANDAAGDPTGVKSAAAEFARIASRSINILTDPNKRGGLSEDQARAAAAQLIGQIQIARLWANADIEAVKADLASGTLVAQQSPENAAILTGWLAIRTGDLQAGIAALEPYQETNPFAGLGVAVAEEAQGRTEQAKATYTRLVRAATTEVAGAWARSRLRAMGVDEVPARAAALEKAVASIPGWIDQMATDPRQFLQLQTTLVDPEAEATDRSAIRITLQNIAPIPLALGPDRALNSRLLLAPRLDNFGTASATLIRPEVIDIDRRLRLNPQERLTLTIWPDAGQSGWLMEAVGNRSLRLRWRIIQGFVSDPRGGFRPGPMCIATETESGVRRPMADATLSPDSLAKRVASDPTSLLMRLAAVTRADLFQPLLTPTFLPQAPPPPGRPASEQPPPRIAPADDRPFKPVADAFAARYPTLDLLDRAILVTTLPHSRIAPVMATVDQVIRADPDPLIQCLALASRAADPDDPLLVKDKDSDDPRLREAAALLADRLAGKSVFFARLSPAQMGVPSADSPAAGATTGANAGVK